jgi:hypothetical protein
MRVPSRLFVFVLVSAMAEKERKAVTNFVISQSFENKILILIVYQHKKKVPRKA